MQAIPRKSGPKFDVFASGCPSRQAFDQIFSRWGILVLCRLSREGTRFGMLRRSIEGISEKMLSQTLKTLEEEGLVRRREWDEKPPHVEYSLTEAGMMISRDVARLIGDLYGVLGKSLPRKA
jgi:DNA-binding HxlR family transcriptional regulator